MKSELRKQIRQRLAGLDEMTRYARSLAACKRLTGQPEFRQASVVMLYLSLPNEVETAAAALSAWQAGKTVVVPKVLWEHKRLLPVEITSLDTGMVPGKHGVPDPTVATPVPLEMLDLIVVPGLVYDRRGHRLGRGAGFYDRFLSQASIRAVTCGLAYREQVVDEVPAEKHDHAIDMLVTDEETIHFRR